MLTLAELSADTAFERFALENAAALQSGGRAPKGVFDLRDSSVVHYKSGGAAMGGAKADELRRSLRPLMFGAAWKIVDLVIEYCLQIPSGSRLSIDEKVKRVRAMTNPIKPFQKYPQMWGAVTSVYESTCELRNGLIHRRAEITKAGELKVRDRCTNRIYTITDDQQLAFCRLAQRLIAASLAEGFDDRSLFDFSNQLTILAPYSGGWTTRIGRDETRIYELVADLASSDGWIVVDVPQLLTAIRTRIPHAIYVDLVGYTDEQQSVALVGALDLAPQRTHMFTLDKVPSWLDVQTRLN